jgi:hypothetical protein
VASPVRLLRVDQHRLHIQEERHQRDITSNERFDRIAFTMHALRVLSPRLTVAVYPRTRSLHVDKVRDLWATLGVPPDASREHIILAVAELAGVQNPSWLLDLAMASPGPQGA